MSARLTSVAALLLVVVAALSAETFDKVEYLSGKAGVKKHKGQITLTATQLQFVDKDKVLFAVPLTTVTKVTNTRNAQIGTDGFPLLGIAFSHVEEFVYVTAETAESADVLVFRVKRKTSPGIVAKIEFAAKRAKG